MVPYPMIQSGKPSPNSKYDLGLKRPVREIERVRCIMIVRWYYYGWVSKLYLETFALGVSEVYLGTF